MTGLNHETTSDVEGDLAIDLEVTSNRPDCLGHIGIAREAAVVLGREVTIPEVKYPTGTPGAAESTRVEVSCPDLCPRYIARVIRGVKIGPSPEWMRRRLATCGVRAINNVVDVTNYVLLEASQPLHAFDLDKLAEHRIVVRRARPGETIVAIDQKRYELQKDMCVIADANRAVAVAGVMGGFDTEVNDGTTNLLIESAEFDPLSVRRTSRALGLSSPSSYRFERGIDPAGVEWASRRCCQLITETAGGVVADGAVVVEQPIGSRTPIVLRFGQLKRILGIDVDPAEARQILVRLGLVELRHDATRVEVRPPSWRRDLEREIDLIEEVGRIHGYDHVPEDVEVPMTTAPRTESERVESAIRQTLVGAGFFEAATMSFVEQSLVECFRVWSDAKPLAVEHSSRRQENVLRQSLVPSLLVARRLNESRGTTDSELFEIARVYLPNAAGGGGRRAEGQQRVDSLPDEPIHLALASGRDVREMKGVIENLLTQLHATATLAVQAIDRPEFASRGAELRLDGQLIGFLGQLSNRLAAQFDLRATCVVAELNVDRLRAAAQLIPQYRSVPNLPASQRELSLIVDDAVLWSAVESVVRSAAGPHLESIQFLDLYRGRPIPASRKSLHFGMTFRAADRTLTHEEVDQSQQAVIAACKEKLGAELRGG
jgi:phenylalanyl-tRNA synthetase beta chain